MHRVPTGDLLSNAVEDLGGGGALCRRAENLRLIRDKVALYRSSCEIVVLSFMKSVWVCLFCCPVLYVIERSVNQSKSMLLVCPRNYLDAVDGARTCLRAAREMGMQRLKIQPILPPETSLEDALKADGAALLAWWCGPVPPQRPAAAHDGVDPWV